ncbi:hypothetical protein [Klenkia taihuensis]|uniref:Polysaccharide deacetylase n=1 Tax=Klenkia taihuensis TaxID=1225127 RepID=A0A1I1G7S2_9ACTN|nr:hypothetical protein [Klenkia taihuensis]GHE09915.1 hypothetical protein GCM10011381_16940 [Klenkia taihuensis]SFC07585.1 hypothetical protein SAMN05661030_0038 [Klenkia taihuensis]
MTTDAELLAAARAVAAEDEDRAGVAMLVALLDRTGTATTGTPDPADRALAADVRRAWEVLRAADPDTTVQDALAALALLHLRPGTQGGRGGGGGGGLAAWRPGDTGRPDHGTRDAEADAVVDAVLHGRHLRVVNWHNTPASHAEELRRELTWYAERFSPVTEADLHTALDTGRWADPRPGVVPAFFDGFASAVQVAAPLCEELGLVGWFYPPTEFLDCPPEQQRAFAAEHDLGVLDEDLPGDAPLAMTWDDLADLAGRHVVCGHSATHASSASVRTPADVDRQVLRPLARLTEVIGRRPAGWAWLGGTPFDPAAPGDAAVAESGIRLWTSNAAVERLR